MTLAIINDYVLNRRIKLLLDDDDFSFVDDNWSATDGLLVQLQHTQTFAGRTKWSDLDPFHYRVMILRNIAKLFEGVDIGDGIDLESEVMRSLNFLICALVRCLERRAESHIEMIRLVRVGEADMSVEFQATLAMEIAEPKPSRGTRPDFAVVVDNTTKE